MKRRCRDTKWKEALEMAGQRPHKEKEEKERRKHAAL
jgi:hypothetical protein